VAKGGDGRRHRGNGRQLSPAAAKLPGLRIVRTIEDALAAIKTIVEQGEGSSCGKSNRHSSRFQAMRKEWSALEAANPSFVPYLRAAHDPGMRKPAALPWPVRRSACNYCRDSATADV